MDKLPKRRKFKDNPYTLLIENNKYYILFKDNKNILHKECVNKEIFEVFDENERYENSRFFEYSTKYVKSIVNIENARDSKYTDEYFINKLTIQEIKQLLNELPDIQKRRFIKYYFEEKIQDEIAKEEKVNKSSINRSIDSVIEKILKKFKK